MVLVLQPQDELLEGLRSELLGQDAAVFVAMMFSLASGRTQAPPEFVERARRLELIEPERLQLTRVGYLVADSMREYTFWVERGRQLPCEGRVPHLSAAYFAGKRTVEIGCGAGCNLWSLASACTDLVGVEPEPLYPQIGRILCEREGREPPNIQIGRGEALPFGADEFDVALCISSHQYMDLTTGLREIARILRPGGELILVGGSLGTFLGAGFEQIRQGTLRTLKSYLLTIANTVSYQTRGRRLVSRRGQGTTAYPIYPTTTYMKKEFASGGLEPSRPIVDIHPEKCFSYRKTRPIANPA